jgi:hypothetical protein
MADGSIQNKAQPGGCPLLEAALAEKSNLNLVVAYFATPTDSAPFV